MKYYKGIPILDHIPEGWIVVPNYNSPIFGYVLISNGVSRFNPNGERKTAYVKAELFNRRKP